MVNPPNQRLTELSSSFSLTRWSSKSCNRVSVNPRGGRGTDPTIKGEEELGGVRGSDWSTTGEEEEDLGGGGGVEVQG